MTYNPTAELSTLEADFLSLWQLLAPTAPLPEREVRLIDGRKFRFDFVWRAANVVVECQGAVYQQGRHSRGAGQESDYEKHNLATALGCKIIYLTSGMLKRDPVHWIDLIRNLVEPMRMVDVQAGYLGNVNPLGSEPDVMP